MKLDELATELRKLRQQPPMMLIGMIVAGLAMALAALAMSGATTYITEKTKQWSAPAAQGGGPRGDDDLRQRLVVERISASDQAKLKVGEIGDRGRVEQDIEIGPIEAKGSSLVEVAPMKSDGTSKRESSARELK